MNVTLVFVWRGFLHFGTVHTVHVHTSTCTTLRASRAASVLGVSYALWAGFHRAQLYMYEHVGLQKVTVCVIAKWTSRRYIIILICSAVHVAMHGCMGAGWFHRASRYSCDQRMAASSRMGTESDNRKPLNETLIRDNAFGRP